MSSSPEVESFIQDKFFELTKSRLTRCQNLYEKKYGKSAAQYFKKTYAKWKSKTTGMSGQTRRRILECVPPVLEMDDQFYILSSYVSDSIKRHRSPRHMYLNTSKELHEAYTTFCNRIIESEPVFDWFIRDVFEADIIDNLKNVYRFHLVEAAHKNYASVIQDIKHIRCEIVALDAAASATYSDKLLNADIEISFSDHFETEPLPDLVRPENAGKFKAHIDRVLINLEVESNANVQRGQYSHTIMTQDLRSVSDQINELKSGNADAKLEAQGAGGIVKVTINKRNRGDLALTAGFRLACGIGLIGIVVMVTIGALATSGAAGVWVALIGIPISAGIWEWASSSYSEYKDYEQRRTKTYR